MRKRTDGFTLVELMVVVLIIGIIVAIAVPVFKAAKATTEKNGCQANQRMIMGAVEAYNAAHPTAPFTNTSRYPWSGEDPRPLSKTEFSPIVPEMLKAVPRCPSRKVSGVTGSQPGDYFMWMANSGYYLTSDSGPAYNYNNYWEPWVTDHRLFPTVQPSFGTYYY